MLLRVKLPSVSMPPPLPVHAEDSQAKFPPGNPAHRHRSKTEDGAAVSHHVAAHIAAGFDHVPASHIQADQTKFPLRGRNR